MYATARSKSAAFLDIPNTFLKQEMAMKNNNRTTRQPARKTRQPARSSPASIGTPLKAGIGLVAGAAIGGAIMFLFDPKVGSMRRRRIGEVAHGAMDQSRDAIGAAIGAVASHAGDVAGHLRSHLSDAAEHVTSFAGDAANSAMAAGSGIAHGAASSVKQYANDAHGRAMSFADQQLRRIGNALPHDREHHYVGQTACAVSSLALGAGAVYFFDSENGARRRSEFRGRLFSTISSVGDMFNAAGRQVRDMIDSKMHGAAAMDDSDEPTGDLEAQSMPEMGNSPSPQTIANPSA
jgi:hypothetical protein